MTLDIQKFIENSVRTQSKIHHLDVNVKAVNTNNIPKSVTSLIYKDYGEKYLDDADYVAFFWGRINKDTIDKLFNVVDKALGKSANKLTDKDFKKINISSEDESSDNEDSTDNDENEEEIDIEVDEEIPDEANEEKSSKQQNDEKTGKENKKDTEEKSDDKKDQDNKLNEDEDEKIEIETKVEENIPTLYFFLKITSK